VVRFNSKSLLNRRNLCESFAAFAVYELRVGQNIDRKDRKVFAKGRKADQDKRAYQQRVALETLYAFS
jgi:hypothetical protein